MLPVNAAAPPPPLPPPPPHPLHAVRYRYPGAVKVPLAVKQLRVVEREFVGHQSTTQSDPSGNNIRRPGGSTSVVAPSWFAMTW